ncbi:DUF1707 domain-containing protein [Corynebacterium timonense]|uniref:Cell wall-active antibiotics response 4TMS YvqF n=1 Tax=Corynebacterium timonense TaxID=441500 RepID=A0A1H1SUU5_9CORY|nr:DUF1707 domain-containing protein [Corynebacterium timonense]SDS51797.1 Cell wall-active antibiotics response 4TMS YvqF [Corynebacterium timonense]
MNTPTPPEPPRLRASRSQRERAAHALSDALSDGQISLSEFDARCAQVWDATYSDELDTLTADLSPVGETPGVVSHTAPWSQGASARVDPSANGSALTVSVFGATDRRGSWAISPQHLSITVFSGNDLDLRHAVLESPDITITCVAIFGGIDIIVPEDAKVITEGVGIFGGFGDSARTPVPPRADAPVIRVRGLAAFGGVDIVRKPGGSGA